MRARTGATSTHPSDTSTLGRLPAPLELRPLPSPLCQVLLSAVPMKTKKTRTTIVTKMATSASPLQNRTRLPQPPLRHLLHPAPFIPTNKHQPSLHPKPFPPANFPSTHNNHHNIYNHNSRNLLRLHISPQLHMVHPLLVLLFRILLRITTTTASSPPSQMETSI